jgi:hypothetical protein
MPPITSTHNMLDRGAAPRSRLAAAAQAKYTYLFPDLANDPLVGCFAGTDARQTRNRLRQFEIATRIPLSDMPVMQMRLPAAYTYFGQFMNHDISAPVGDVVSQDDAPTPTGVVGAVDPPGLDRSHRATVAIILENFFNEHAEPLTLASLYGDGPESADAAVRGLYETDGKRFRLALTRREQDSFFTNQLIKPGRVIHATGAPDIPRNGGPDHQPAAPGADAVSQQGGRGAVSPVPQRDGLLPRSAGAGHAALPLADPERLPAAALVGRGPGQAACELSFAASRGEPSPAGIHDRRFPFRALDGRVGL